MKTYFVINPVSGKNVKIDFENDLIIPACEKAGIEYEIYHTTAAGDGIRFVDETAAAHPDETCRFYAVGGDGTLYEIVNGAYGHKNAQVGVIPKGSGNDYIRLFGDVELFRNIEAQLNATPHVQDALLINGDEIAINQASLGFDAESCAKQGAMKNVPGALGHVTYLLAGLYCMFTRVWWDFKVTIDGKEIRGPFIQCVGCNSRWYGSGIKVAPFALPDDHMADFVIMRRTSSWPMMFMPMMVNWQVKGNHTKFGWTEYYRGKKMEIVPKKPCQTNVDGECHEVDKLTIELIEDGLTFLIPEGSTYFADKESGVINNGIQKKLRNREPFKSITSEYSPFNVLVNKGLLAMIDTERNYLNFAKYKQR